MTAQDRFRRIDTLFRAASALPPEAREAYLTRQCAGETSILTQVQSLLRADQHEDGLLDRPALVPVASALQGNHEPQAAIPEHIGRYRILRKIGAGGMGVVFEAEQENPRRRVAVKLMQRGADSRRLLQRFQQEAQILGRLQHPGIAQILEAGSTDEQAGAQPYFVMELVQGDSLLDHARDRHLGFRRRLELFAQVCDAVQYAHRNGVVHRDLKPGNILVVATAAQQPDQASDGPSPAQPKVLDFGVARLTDSDMQAVTQQTTVGELVGTVPYMSPEQAAGDPARIDWRSDVYSLGVILYELLTGRLPHEVRHLLVHEAVRSIREDEPTPAGSIDRTLRGDVETILAKALEKDKQRRYQSAAELASDIRRYLNQQPIAARPASALYRLGKFARRNKAIVIGVTVAFLALAIGTVASLRQAIIADRARAEEQRLRGEAERQSYRACMLAASSALRRHEVAEAERHLAAAPETQRGWEWTHLNSRLDECLIQRKTESSNPWWFAISPDGGSVAACNSGGKIILWNLADWSQRAKYALQGSVTERRIIQLVFSPDGRTLRADTRRGSTSFDADTLAVIAKTERSVMARSRDGGVSARFDETESPPVIRVEEYATGHELFRVSGDALADTMLNFSRDGRYLAASLPRNEGLFVYHCSDGALLWRRPDLDLITELCFDTDGSRLAVARQSGDACILKTAGGETLVSLRGHTGSIGGMDFSPDGLRVATASNDGTVRLWNAASGIPFSTMHASQTGVYSAVFMPDGATVVTAAAGGGLRWWDATTATDPFVLPAPGYVYSVSFSPDGRTLAAACLTGDRPLRVWDVATGRERWAGLDGQLTAVAFSRDGDRIAVGQTTGDTQLIDAADARPVATFSAPAWRTDWVFFDSDGDRLIMLEHNGRLTAHDLAGGRPIQERRFQAKSSHGCRATASPDGTLLVVAADNRIHLLDAGTWDEMATLEGHKGSLYALALSPDGSRLVSGGTDRTLRVWDIPRRVPIATLTGHSDEVFAAIFTPDGKRILSGGRDCVIRVWDAQELDEITQLHGHTSYVYCLAFSPDGRTLASGGGDGTVRLWDTRPYRQQRPR